MYLVWVEIRKTLKNSMSVSMERFLISVLRLVALQMRLYKNGPNKVILDVGYNQLDYKLLRQKIDINARYGAYEFPFRNSDDTKGQQMVSIDVSFISLKLILPPLKPILKEGRRRARVD